MSSVRWVKSADPKNRACSPSTNVGFRTVCNVATSMKPYILLCMLATVISLLGLSGCVQTYGRYHSSSELAQIRKNLSTKGDVIAVLGNPDSTSVDNSGKTIFTYIYVKVTPAPVAYGNSPVVGNSGDMRQTTIVVFNANGIVTDVKSTTNSRVLRGRFGSDGVGNNTQPWAPAALEGVPQ